MKVVAEIRDVKLGNKWYKAIFHNGGLDKGFLDENRLQEYVKYLEKLGYKVIDKRTLKA